MSKKTSKPEVNGLEVPPEKRDNPADELERGEDVTALDFASEVAARSADTPKPSDHFTKVFVLGPGTYTKATGFDHEPNLAATRQYALDAGLWPTGDAEYVSTKTHADGRSQVLTYRVPVAPAHRVEPESAHPEVIDPETGDVGEAENADASKVDKTEV